MNPSKKITNYVTYYPYFQKESSDLPQQLPRNFMPRERQTSFYQQASSKNKVHFVSLGCSRNLVDSEVMLGILLKAGYEVAEDLKKADYLVLNTCAFLKAARDESLQYLDTLIKRKQPHAKIILTGCMASKHKKELEPWKPHIHYILGSGNVEDILSAIDAKEQGEKLSSRSYLEMGEVPRKLSTPKHYAYLKIAEGCRKRCAFCIIPTIKGPLKSKPKEQIVKEFRSLLHMGVKEIILIAQDLGDYGKDLSSNNSSQLEDLLQELLKEQGDFWIRMLYLYPDEISDGIIQIMKNDSRLLPYVDIPLQHINDNILKNMRRKTSREQILTTLSSLRSQVPNVYIRSSLIVGFPGESEQDFSELMDFVQKGWIDNLGIFMYSQEEGSAAYQMPNQISQKVKKERLKLLSEIQQQNVNKHNSQMIGKHLEAVVDGFHPDSNLLLTARFYGQAPEVDPCIIINEKRLQPVFGERYIIEITGSAGYDLVGKIIKKAQ